MMTNHRTYCDICVSVLIIICHLFEHCVRVETLVENNIFELTENHPTFCDVENESNTWLRHPANCSRYFACAEGQVREMPPCAEQYVFSVKLGVCVHANSKHDDCQEVMYNIPRDVSENDDPALLWHPRFSEDPSVANGDEPTSILSDDDIDTTACNVGAKTTTAHPDNCAWYYNCSVNPDAVMQTFYSGFIMECPYPQLFSVDTMQCEDFEDVECRGRYEPKSPCDYRANHCHETSHCIPCWVRYASCLNQVDGLNPWPDLEWKPFFVECYRERTVFQGVCDKSAVFSPLTRACETPYSIPRQNGGWRPSCEERRDGVYPDEYGRCDVYYVCKAEIFTGFFRCDSQEMFDPITGHCEDPEKVPYPCGDSELPNLCENRIDGFYLDIFGRCTHYMECKSGELAAVSMCPSGVFNPETRKCDVSQNVIKPCGNLPNPCVLRDDGYFANTEKDCVEYFKCERGFMVAKFKCPANTLYNDVIHKCDDVSNTPPPCGIAPECTDKEDGFYPALNKGMQFYYECKNNSFVMYKRCNEEHGGLVFSPTNRNCDFPKHICLDLNLGPEIC